jgi:hypothetical protein
MKMIAVAAATALAAFTAGVATHALLPSMQSRADDDNPEESLPGSTSISTDSAAGASSRLPRNVLDRIERAARETAAGLELGNIHAIAESITAANARETIEAVRSRTDINRKSAILGPLLAAWARQDPRAAVAYAQSISEPTLREMAIAGAASGWTEIDLSGVRQWTASLPPGSLRRHAEDAIIRTLAETQPQQALGIVLSGESPGDAGRYVDEIFADWAARDSQEALRGALGLGAEVLRYAAVRATVVEWGRKDPQAAVQWAEEWARPAPFARGGIARLVVGAWIENDFDSACAWLAQQPAEDAEYAVVEAALKLSEEEPEKSLMLAELVTSPKEQDKIIGQSILTLFRFDPPAARDWIAAQTDPAVQSIAWCGLVMGVAQNDPATAATLLSNIADENQRRNTAAGILHEWSSSDPDAAMQWAFRSTDAAILAPAVPRFMGRWMKTDAGAALEWFQSQTDAEIRGRAVPHIMAEWMGTDPGAAMQWFASLSPDDGKDKAIPTIMVRWVQSDLPSALKWFESVPPGGTRDTAIRAFGATLIKSGDKEKQRQGLQWILSIGNARLRDEQLMGGISTAAESDPNFALPFAFSVSNPDWHDHLITSVVDKWTLRDPAAARQWIMSQTNLSPALKERLLKIPNP